MKTSAGSDARIRSKACLSSGAKVEANHLLTALMLAIIAKLPGPGPKLAPQRALVRGHVSEPLGLIDSQPG